ncbi:LysR family transcriptional regulator [Francisella tularensis subsp. novicida]|uniref:LysR family transcriptional regulator n=2 Tax=Francisella tularensis TaxID=263 RepID=A0A6I4RLR9_FRATU|nr:LysR family transcriptional regulator [Francisella tularensis]ABK90163.1 transcriptional regulator, LysR family [Francisella tularensis subsp. novicida U112]AJI61369.1 bacterial regulatory helix-turn-helix, lysR family protein [Francisella tularensis subsp. novicida U112]EDX19686.1 LysR substrate binding domain protein [Francisella tularensis subsp. novicida FTE]MBK2036382.1 LysR family transcriptional regulator [Francisella tularensis subsp. novicida]MBK2117016.1 LysR family transcriptiona
MGHLERLKIFIKAAHLKSFSKAAKAIGISPPVISKQIQILETKYRKSLFNRNTRTVHLTEYGKLLYEKASLILNELEATEEKIFAEDILIDSELKISAPNSFGIKYLCNIFSKFAIDYPKYKLNINLSDSYINIIDEDFDLVIRIGALDDSNLITKKLMPMPSLLCASEQYLKNYGIPKTIKDLENHLFIQYNNHSSSNRIILESVNKTEIINVRQRIVTNSAEMMLQGCLDGLGIAKLPLFEIIDKIHDKKLVHLLPDARNPIEKNLYLISSRDKYRLKKVRLLSAYIEKNLPKIEL